MDYKTLDALIPESIKTAIRSRQTLKIARVMTGLEDPSFANIAQYLGTKIASRHAKWQPIADGLLALHKLRG
jgi:hypothetical protein